MVDTKLLLRWVCTVIAIFAAVKLLPGLYFNGPWWQLGIIALTFGLLNAPVRPVLTVLTCPLIILTHGLFILVINAAMLWLTAKSSEVFGIDRLSATVAQTRRLALRGDNLLFHTACSFEWNPL
jgi:putative membrane protein